MLLNVSFSQNAAKNEPAKTELISQF